MIERGSLCCTMQLHNAALLRHSNGILLTIYALSNIPNLSKQSHWPLTINNIINFLQTHSDRTTKLLGWISLLLVLAHCFFQPII